MANNLKQFKSICYLDKQEFYDCLLMLIDDKHQDLRLKQALCWGYCRLAETCWETGNEEE